MKELIYISEDRVRQLLTWDLTISATEKAMLSVSEKRAVQNPRSFTVLPDSSNILLSMPGYIQDDRFGGLGCKLVTFFPTNPRREIPLPAVLANIMLFDTETGQLKAVVSGTEITTWRTAAASVVATKYILVKDGLRGKKVLAILGAGVQGRIHAIAFQHFFSFDEIHVWNRTYERAEKLVEELKSISGFEGKILAVHDNVPDCVKEADIIVTATSANSPILKRMWLKRKVHINAVGVGVKHYAELEESIYLNADVFIDHWEGAKKELAGLEQLGIQFYGEVGELISGTVTAPIPRKLTVFQSLGMAVEDCAMARMIYDLHVRDESSH